MADIATLPYRCPKCFHTKRFPNITTLRNHLEVDHSYVYFPIPSSTHTSPRLDSSNLIPRSPMSEKKLAFSQTARELEKQLLLSKGLEGFRYESQHRHSWPHISSQAHQPLDALLSSTHMSPRNRAIHNYSDDVLVQEKTDEVHQLKRDLSEKDHDLAEASQKLQEMSLERLKLHSDMNKLGQQIENRSLEIVELKLQLDEQQKEIEQKETTLVELNQFLQDTAAKQSTARDSLQKYVDDLVNRAQKAEIEATMLRQSMTSGLTPRTPDSSQEVLGDSSVENFSTEPKALQSQQSNRDLPPAEQMEQSRSDTVLDKGTSPNKSSSPTSLPHLHPDVTPSKQSSIALTVSTNPDPEDSPLFRLEQQQQQLQQQLEKLQHQQFQLQQSLVRLGEQPTHFDQTQDYLRMSVASQTLSNRSPETLQGSSQDQGIYHDYAKSDHSKQQIKISVRHANPNQRSAPREQYSVKQKERQPNHTRSHSTNSVPRKQSPHREQHEYQQILNTSPPMHDGHHHHHHHTLPRQQTSTLQANHSTPSPKKQLSSTLPPYSGSELPDFTAFELLTDVPLESTAIEVLDRSNAMPTYGIPKRSVSFDDSPINGSCSHPTNRDIQILSVPRGQISPSNSKQYRDPRLPSSSALDLTSSHSSTDSLNLQVLEGICEDRFNRSPSPRTNGKSIPLNQALSGSYKPSRPPVHTVPHGSGVASLPNGIPKNTYEDHTSPTQHGHRSRTNSASSSRSTSPSSISMSELSEDSLTDVTSTLSVSTRSGYAVHTGENPSMTRSQKEALLCIFSFLNLQTLLNCALVCQDWKHLSRHPSLWKTVALRNQRISSKFLQTISKWCTELEWLTLENLRPRGQRPFETKDDYYRDTRGCLEPGLEYLLHRTGSQLISLKIVNCLNILTERSLWLASCYCRNLCSLTYISHTDPVGHEVIWALGAGCRKIESLKIPPGFPCDQPHKFDNKCVQMIGRCWTMLLAISIGGQDVEGRALISIAKNCPRLQVLELDHMSKITEQVAIAMTRNGLRGLQILIFRHTPVTTKSIMQFNGACSQLRSLFVHLTPSDYFQELEDDENADQNAIRFEQLRKKLQALAKQPGLRGILHLEIKVPT